MRDAAANLEFEEAGRLRDEIKRLQAVELAVADDPMARQSDVEDKAGAYGGDRKYGKAANVPAASARKVQGKTTRFSDKADAQKTRARKPTDADMGPHNMGGGEARPKGASTRKVADFSDKVDAKKMGVSAKQRRKRPGV